MATTTIFYNTKYIFKATKNPELVNQTEVKKWQANFVRTEEDIISKSTNSSLNHNIIQLKKLKLQFKIKKIDFKITFKL